MKCLLSLTASTAVNLLPQQRALRLIGFCIVIDESNMQSRTKDEVKLKTKERLWKLTNNSTSKAKMKIKSGESRRKSARAGCLVTYPKVDELAESHVTFRV